MMFYQNCQYLTVCDLQMWQFHMGQLNVYVCYAYYRALKKYATISFFFPVLELNLRAFTLSHSTSPIFVKGFSI
jgi:hypothetical protein